MNVEQHIRKHPMSKKIYDVLDELKKGEGLTKEELAQAFGYQQTVIDKWYKTIPGIKNYRVYIKDGCSYKAVFVNLKYKHELILRGKAKESI